MKKITLKTFIIVALSTLTLLLAVFLGIFYIDFKNINNTESLKNDIRDLYINWLDNEHAQHDFFLEYHNDVVFFQTEQNTNIKKSEKTTKIVKQEIDSLMLSIKEQGFEQSEDLEQFDNEVEQMYEIFKEIKHLLFLRGSKKTGIIGNCFTFYNLSVNSVQDKQLKKMLVQAHISFLNYINNPNIKDYEQFLDYFMLMNRYIEQYSVVDYPVMSDTVVVVNSTPAYSGEFVSYVNDYKKSFSKLVNLDRKLFLNDQANLMHQWSSMIHSFNEILIKTVADLYKQIEIKIQTIEDRMLIAIIILFIIFLVAVIVIPRILVSKLYQIKDYFLPLREGVIPKAKHHPAYFSDVIEMANMFHNIVEYLRDVSTFAKEIGNENFKYTYTPLGDKDEIGNALILLRDNLVKAQKEDVERRKEDKIREWTNTGVAKFSDILRQSAKDLSELSISIIKELVAYLDANQGGLFVLNDEDRENIEVNLVASYAYSKERKKHKTFRLGEGLVGTCAVEKATVYMTEIPTDYISITSGLGDSTPRSLLITPLKHEENVLGVLEIASFNEMEQYQIEFVEKIAESIASTLSVTKINERTSKLLESAKVEAERRSRKEKELESELFNLTEYQKEMQFKERKLRDLLTLVGRVSYIIEMDIDGNVLSVPETLTSKLGIMQNDIISYHYSELDHNEKSVLKNDEFWQNLINGHEQQCMRKYIISSQEELWFSDYVFPYLDERGQVTKFVSVSFDNTDKIKENNGLAEEIEKLKAKEKDILQNLTLIDKEKEAIEFDKKELQNLYKKTKEAEEAAKKDLEESKKELTRVNDFVKNSELQNARMRLMIENSNEPIQIIENGEFVDCNEATLELFGYNEKADFLKSHISVISPPQQEDGANSLEKAKEMLKMAEENGIHKFEWIHRRFDGTDFVTKITLVAYPTLNNVQLFALLKKISD